MDINRDWLKREFQGHEMMDMHRDIDDELDFFRALAAGNLAAVEANIRANDFTNPEGMGKLSDNPLQNFRYHFVVTAAIATRYCIMAGLEHEKAYNLSDFYIKNMDKCTTIEGIADLHDLMCINLCKQMVDINRRKVLSKPVAMCLDYIYNHIHFRITVGSLAEQLNLSPSYLSKLFSQEMGVSLSQYIMDMKIQKACDLLNLPEYSLADIANYLSFSSESHFIQAFRKKMGTSPDKYRRTMYHSFLK